MSIQVGQTVQYVNSEGLPKAAVVVVAPDNQDPRIDTPLDGHAHLLVFSLVSGPDLRGNVPSLETAASIPDYTVDGVLVGYFKYV